MADFRRGAGGLSRRDFLRGGLTAGGALAFGGLPALAQRVIPGSGSDLVTIRLTAKPMSFQIRDGAPTATWGYESISKGVSSTPRVGFLGPVLRLNQKSYLSVDFRNELPEDTTVHWHGLDVPAIMDGHPIMSVAPGGRYNYAFRILNRAGTYWFHPHPDMRTGYQVNMGMAGAVIVSDPEEQAVTLPRGNRDLIFILQDRVFDENNQFVYTNTAASGFLGNTIVINGQVAAFQEVVTGVYRLRFLNGSNARIYKLAWSDGTPMTVIGSDHGLLRTPETKPYVMLVPGERVEIWADFRGRSPGDMVRLDSLQFSAGQGGGGASLPQGYYCQMMEFRVTQSVNDPIVLPTTLSSIPQYQLSQAANLANPRVIPISRNGTEWRLNGSTFEMNNVGSNEITSKGMLEVWEFRNDTAGSMLMTHPMHLHGSPFQVVERSVSSAWQNAFNTVRDGLVESGWKDTFLLMPGERVKILTKPMFYTGRFLYHCHNLEHEDMGMMRNYDVV